MLDMGVAQLVEHRSPKPGVEGSSPSAHATRAGIFLVVSLIVFLIFSILGIFEPESVYLSVLKVSGIGICFLYSLISYFKNDKSLVAALFLTLVADVLLAVNNFSTLGVALFALAQFFHTMRLSEWRKRFYIGYFVAILTIFLVGLAENAEPIFIAGSIYAVSLFSNLILAREWYRKAKTKEAKNAYLGFLLFVGCDLNVLLSFFTVTGVIVYTGIYKIANYLAWEFYFPSQFLLSKSGKV